MFEEPKQETEMNNDVISDIDNIKYLGIILNLQLSFNRFWCL